MLSKKTRTNISTACQSTANRLVSPAPRPHVLSYNNRNDNSGATLRIYGCPRKALSFPLSRRSECATVCVFATFDEGWKKKKEGIEEGPTESSRSRLPPRVHPVQIRKAAQNRLAPNEILGAGIVFVSATSAKVLRKLDRHVPSLFLCLAVYLCVRVCVCHVLGE